MGSIYKRGNTWWIKYYRNGKSYRESSGTTKKMVAKKLLDRREGDIAQGKIPGIQFEKVFFDDLAEDFLRDYRINQRKSLERAERSVELLKAEFEGLSVPRINTSKINQYIERRKAEGAKNATINRELAALKRMLNLGAEQSPPLVDRVPKIHMLKENNTRKGFFEHSEFQALRGCLPHYLKGFVTFGYKTGWRVSEITGLQWKQVDLDIGVVRLEVGETKNDDARTVYMDNELKTIFSELWANRKSSEKLLLYVFLNRHGTGRIKRFDKSWNKACEESGIGHRYFHDLRRTAVRNMIRSGVPETVAMKISGHKTRAIFDRYNITNDEDLVKAAHSQEIYLESRSGTISGTIHKLGKKKGAGETA